MASSSSKVFPLDGLEINRSGALTDQQRKGFRAWSRSNRRSALSSAAFLVAGSALILFFASPTAPPVARVLFPAIGLAVAGFLIVRAVLGVDALSRDVSESRVESAEGAIGKRFRGRRGAQDTYYVDVGDMSFTVSRDTYASAPDHGLVRLYYLPRSRKIVNLERLPDPPIPDAVHAMNVLESLGAAARGATRSERNEAHAVIGAMEEAMKASFPSSPAGAPKRDADSPPLADAIVGTWSNPLMTVTFTARGRVTVQMPGATRDGRWSVDRAGRLQSDVTGQPETTDAWVTGDQLTISVQGERMTLERR